MFKPNPILHIFKSYNFKFLHIFQIQQPLGLLWKLDFDPCIYYTFLKIQDCIDMRFYNKLKLRIV
jgi:hypothetical protein